MKRFGRFSRSRPKSKGRKVWAKDVSKHHSKSKRDPHTTFHVRKKELDSLFMPLYKVRFDGNGVNYAQLKTLTNLDGATANKVAQSGDWDCFSSLPGRQSYMEFQCLPLVDMSDIATAVGVPTTISRYAGGMMNLANLINECLKLRNLVVNQVNVQDSGASLVNTANVVPLAVTTLSSDIVYNLFKTTKMVQTDVDNQEFVRVMNTVVLYQGGKQVHKFQNVTGAPIYMEFVEYKPREFLSLSAHQYTTAANATSNYLMSPGLYESIYYDRKYEMANTQGAVASYMNAANPAIIANNVTGNNEADRTAGFNELDDKDFKLKGKMPLTSKRWSYGAPKRVRVDPGSTYTYELIMKPFSIKIFDLIHLMQIGHQHNVGATEPFKLTANGNNTSPFYLSPLCSRGLQVRAWGSMAHCLDDPAAKETQFDSYAGVAGFSGTMPYIRTAAQGNEGTFPNLNDIKGVATHAVRMIHSMSEYHECRCVPYIKPSNYVRFNFALNALNKDDIGINDDMRIINPLTNQYDEIAGDGDTLPVDVNVRQVGSIAVNPAVGVPVYQGFQANDFTISGNVSAVIPGQVSAIISGQSNPLGVSIVEDLTAAGTRPVYLTDITGAPVTAVNPLPVDTTP